MTQVDGAGPPVVEFRDLVVDFGANRALDHVTLTIRPGEIVGLVGANGAGKSTLGRVLVGEVPYGEFSGEYRLRETETRFADARQAHEAGVVLVHQETLAIDGLSVGENVMLTIEPTRYGFINWSQLHEVADGALRQLGVRVDTRQLLGDAGGVALSELVEVARSIARGSTVFVFDESTSALGADEIRTLLARMRELAGSGAAVIFISHRIEEILSVCDRILVLRDGRLVVDAPRDKHTPQTIVQAMLGSSLDTVGRTQRAPRLAPSLQDQKHNTIMLRDWQVYRSPHSRLDVGPIQLEVGRGEIVGVFGPLGAGKTELLYSLYGLIPDGCRGELWIDRERIKPIKTPVQAIRHGFGLVSAERQKEGIILGLPVLENMMLGHHRLGLRKSRVVRDHEVARTLCKELIEQFGIRTTGPDQPIEALSGGNQQKVLLARAVINSPKVLLLDEPTRGIDVGAKQDVYELIRRMAAQGTSFVVTSLEESELLDLADRILVLRDGQQIALLEASETTEHDLVTLAAGGTFH